MSALSNLALMDSTPAALLFLNDFIVFCTSSIVGGLVSISMSPSTGVGFAVEAVSVQFRTSLKCSTQRLVCSSSVVSMLPCLSLN